MAKNIYVGNLPWRYSDDDLRQMFESHGSVQKAQVIMDRQTGRSRGFGFVEMDNDDEAQRAIDALNGQDCDGRPLTVNEARQREEREPREYRGGSRPMGGGQSRGMGGGGGQRGGYPGGTNRGRLY